MVHQQGLAGDILPHLLERPHDHKPGAGLEAGGHHGEVGQVGATLPGAIHELEAEEAVEEGVSSEAATVVAALLDLRKSHIWQRWTGVGQTAGGNVNLHGAQGGYGRLLAGLVHLDPASYQNS